MKILIFFFSSFLLLNPFNETPENIQKNTSSFNSKSDSTFVYLYTFGLIDIAVSQDNCALKLQKKYGFGYKSKGDCFMNDLGKMREINENNRATRAILEERHGEDWEEKYKKEVDFCRTEQ